MLSFRIENTKVGSRDYNTRYTALTGYLTSIATTLWDDSTSFLVFETESSINEILRECKKAIAPTHDLFFIRQVDFKLTYICGLVHDNSIFKLIPGAKKFV